MWRNIYKSLQHLYDFSNFKEICRTKKMKGKVSLLGKRFILEGQKRKLDNIQRIFTHFGKDCEGSLFEESQGSRKKKGEQNLHTILCKVWQKKTLNSLTFGIGVSSEDIDTFTFQVPTEAPPHVETVSNNWTNELMFNGIAEAPEEVILKKGDKIWETIFLILM